jgi:hypothetical protein
MKIGFDPTKRDKTLKEYGLDFEDTPDLFSSLRRITYTDNRKDYGELREVTMGELEGGLVVVVHKARGDQVRIISMRKANAKEIHWFEKQFSAS